MHQRILFLLHLPPPIHGSSLVGQYIHRSQLINSNFNTKYINLLGSKRINETGKFKFHKVISYLNVIIQLLSSLTAFRPQICYFALSTTGIAFIKDLILIFLIKLFRVKLIYHLHNKGIKKKSENTILKILYQFAFKNTDVIVLSQKLYFDVEKFVPIERVFVCFNGIEDKSKINHIRKSQSVPVILFLSNLIKSKGIFELLEALSVLKLKGNRFECRIIGGEGDIDSTMLYKKISELNLNGTVFYLGKKYDKEKEIELLNSEIFVLPTFYENECFPLVLLEAMSFSLPIISTSEGGIEDIVQNGINGFLVQKLNLEQLIEKLEILIKEPELRAEFGTKSRAIFEKKFTLRTFENSLLNILKDVSVKSI
ncbi:glycosyltransferase [Belliella sp. DSM 107340]|uniref:Glycosyltransferase n=1 Tax=Belliella calami TaxID=2923436 RepID=A0ABS9UPT2_9BACT|nr:glycosyltransferase [Belliella calami]MCH7398632.1 glycosyltransferase [Belliella calami]